MKNILFIFILFFSIIANGATDFDKQFECDWNKFDYEFKIEDLKFKVNYYKGLYEGIERQNQDLRSIMLMQESYYRELKERQNELFKEKYSKKLWTSTALAIILGVLIGSQVR